MIVTLANGQQFDTNSKRITKAKKEVNTPKGVILFEGQSVLDGQPIVAIATFKTSNEKTGNMIQTWIMRSDMTPQEASNQKADSSVCGMCPHRRSIGGGCYVTLHQAPRAVYTAYKKGNYPVYDADKHSQLFVKRALRLGSYGDIAALPFEVVKPLLHLVSSSTGYTHQIKHPNFQPEVLTACQVSADTEKQALKAQEQGYKTFRVKTPNMPVLEGEIECLSDTHGISCVDCGLCNGKQANIVINVHGNLNKRFADKFERII